MSKPSEIKIKSERGPQIYCKYWNHDKEEHSNKAKALVYVVHGYGEHCLYYTEIAEFLIKHGYYVFSNDHVGHGQSEGDRAHVKDTQHYVDDMFTHLDQVKQTFPDTPCFMLAHSMGGTVAILATKKRPDFFKGVVFISPLVIPDPGLASPLRVFLAKAMAKIAPQVHVAKINSRYISRDPEAVTKYENDPLVYHTGIKCGFAMAVNSSLIQIRSQFGEIEFPFLILHAEKDKICDVNGSKLMYKEAKSVDKELQVLPEGYHQLHFEIEPVKTEIYNSILKWFDNRV